jgi:hypothetical protein
MVKRFLTKDMAFTFKWGAIALVAIGVGLLIASLMFNESVQLFDRGIAWIAVGIAVMSILFGIINWDETTEIKEQLDRIEKKLNPPA